MIIVEFWSPGCSVCKEVASAYDEASKDMSQDVTFLRVNTDANAQMALRYGVKGTPTFTIFCRQGKVSEIIGMTSATMLRNTLKDVIRYNASCRAKGQVRYEMDGYG